jgi:excisionase family DNA binding protein
VTATNGHELTPRQAAEVLGVSVDTVRRMVDSGELIARKTRGEHRLIPRAAVEAMKLKLEHPGDPLSLALEVAREDSPAGAVARPDDGHDESAGIEEVQRVALRAVSYDDGGLIEFDEFGWTARRAERARRYLLGWFERRYRDRWPRSEVEALALELLEAWVKRHPARRASPPPVPPAPPEPTLADARRELLELQRDMLLEAKARTRGGVAK